MRSPFGQNWGIPSPFGQDASSGESGILDGYTGTRPIAFLFRAIGSYSGACVRVRRSSDNAETDINFAADGWVDTAAIADHCGIFDGFVTVLYDQNAASSINMVQPSAALQPPIYLAATGSVVTNEHGNPAMLSTEAGRERLRAASSVYSADLLSILIPMQKAATDDLAAYIHDGVASWSEYAGAAEDGSGVAPYSNAGAPLTYVDGTALASNTRNGLHDALEPVTGAADTMMLGIRNLDVLGWTYLSVMGYGSGSYATQATFIGIAMWLDTEIDLADFQAASAAIKTKVSAPVYPATVLTAYFDPHLAPVGSTSDVTALLDLTGNGYNLTYYSDTTAASITTLNGRNVVQLPATADDQSFYNTALGAFVFPNNDGAFTICGVARYTDLSGTQTLWGADNISASFDVLQYDHLSNTTTRFTARPNGGSTTSQTLTPTAAIDTTFAYVHVFDGAGGVKEWVNGAYIGEYSYAPVGTFGTINSLSWGAIRLSATSSTGEVIGVLGAMGFKSSALSDTDAATLAAYLADLYGA